MFIFPRTRWSAYRKFIGPHNLNISDSDNRQLNHIIELADNYEKFVKDIYNYYFDKNYLPFVEWLREIN